MSGFYCTKGSYEFSNAQHMLYERYEEGGKEKIKLTDLSDYVNPEAMTASRDLPDFKERVANGEWQWDGFSPVQDKEVARLPLEYEGLPNGHMGSHKFMIDDFCRAAYEGTMPAMNAWFAARSNIPGLVALESARLGGVTLDVPDLGEAPKR